MSLDLDERQRAMLHEMKVPVWWPPKAVVPAPAVNPGAVTHPPSARLAPPALSPALPPAREPAIAPALAPAAKAALPRPAVLGAASTLNWPDLQQAVVNCQACPLCESRKTTVFGAGQAAADAHAAPQVDWLVVGDAPDESEEGTGQPFAGPAGQLLDNMLKAMGLARHHKVFLLNVVKCRPPGNRNPSPAEIAQCQPFLRRQIELLQPKIILAVGRFGINAVLQAALPEAPQLPLGKLRGQVHFYDNAGVPVPVIATYHPTALLRNSAEKAKAWADLCLAMATLNRPAG